MSFKAHITLLHLGSNSCLKKDLFLQTSYTGKLEKFTCITGIVICSKGRRNTFL